MEQTVIFTGDIYYTQHFPDPCLPFQGRNDKEELFLQPCLGECLHFSLISTRCQLCARMFCLCGKKNTLQSSPTLPDAVVVMQEPQEITSLRMALLQQP